MTVYYTDSFAGKKGESRRLLESAIAEYLALKEGKTPLQERHRAEASDLAGRIWTGENGKPYIDGFSYFSVSHTRNVWAALFADIECGLDIQFEVECRMLSIAERIFDPEDAGRVAAACGSEAEDAKGVFFGVWTRREALAKAAGGTVYDRSLPAVGTEGVSHVSKENRRYTVWDISLPEKGGMHAAVCIRDFVNDAAVPDTFVLSGMNDLFEYNG